MNDKNWPDPKRPGVPMFPDRSGKHAVSGKLLFWYSDIQKWVTSSPISATKEPNYFAECEYHGPALTPTQINEMLAAERERCAKICDEFTPDKGSIAYDAFLTGRYLALAGIAEKIRNLGAAP